MTGYVSKRAAAQAKLEDDDDIQDYKKPWVGLTEEELMEIMGYDKQYGYIPRYARNFVAAIEAKLKEKNT